MFLLAGRRDRNLCAAVIFLFSPNYTSLCGVSGRSATWCDATKAACLHRAQGVDPYANNICLDYSSEEKQSSRVDWTPFSKNRTTLMMYGCLFFNMC